MQKILILFILSLSFASYAQDSEVEDCSAKDNYLQSMITDYYKFIHLTAKQDIELSDEHKSVLLKAGDIVEIRDTNIEDESLLVFDVINPITKEVLPQIIVNTEDPYEATIIELEAQNLFSVTCEVIPMEDHTSQLGRWAHDHKLRKPVKD